MCRNSAPIVCAGPGAAYLIWADCRTWSCPDCRLKLIAEWSGHAETLFLPLSAVFRLSVPTESLDAVTTRLRRHGCGWISVRGSAGWTFYTGSDPGRGAVTLTPELAAKDFRDRLAAAERPADATVWRPVSTSKGWGLNREKQLDPARPRKVRLGRMKADNFRAKMNALGSTVASVCCNGWSCLKALLAVDVLARLCEDFGKVAPALGVSEGFRTGPARTPRADTVPAWTG